jgi:hypothetical protein
MSRNTRPKLMQTMDNSVQSPLRRVAGDGWNGCGYTHAEFIDYFGEKGEEMWQQAVVTWQYRQPPPLSWTRDQSGPPPPPSSSSSSSSFDRPYGPHFRSLDLGMDRRRRQKDAIYSREETDVLHPEKRQREWGPPANNKEVHGICSRANPCRRQLPDGKFCSRKQRCRGLTGSAAISREKHQDDPTCTKESPCRRNMVSTSMGLRVLCSKNNPCGKLRPDPTEEEAPPALEQSNSDEEALSYGS